MASTAQQRDSGTAMVCVGVVAGPKGLRGEVWVRSFTADPASVAAYGPVSDADGGRPLTLSVIDVDAGKGRVLATVAGVRDRTAAEALKGLRLYVPRAAFPEPDADEYYVSDLIGLPVWLAVDGAERPLGRLVGVHEHGAGPFLEIERADDQGVVLAPFTRAVVPVVDVRHQRVVMQAVPGLLDASGATIEATTAGAMDGGGR